MKIERYSNLKPFTIEQKILYANEAIAFFTPQANTAMRKFLKIPSAPNLIIPLSISDFIKYLDLSNKLNDADKYQFPIRDLLNALCRYGVLDEKENRGFDKSYLIFKEISSIQAKGALRLSKSLGAEMIYHSYRSITFQIIGKTNEGDEHCGTGVLIHPNYILTCAHNLTDMIIKKEQEFQGIKCKVIKTYQDSKADIAIIKIDKELTPLDDLHFLNARICQKVYTLGYPKVPRTTEPSLLMYGGEINSSGDEQLMGGQKVFFYSAFSRPGNSGGPIISDEGAVVGLSLLALLNKEGIKDTLDGNIVLPYSVGISTQQIVKFLKKKGLDSLLPVETYQ